MNRRDWPCQSAERQKAYRASWAAKNRDRVRAVGTAAARRRSALVAELKAKPCADCGIQYPRYVMQFDHRDPDEKAFTISARKRVALTTLQTEVEKCDVVCANCHAERTHQRASA